MGQGYSVIRVTNSQVSKSLGAPRIGLPPYMWWSEALHGVASSPGVTFSYGTNNCAAATSFANPITLSAAYDDLLVRAVADVVSTEARAFSNGGCAGLDYWTPNINPYKDPRWGRGAETPGEDAFRIKQYVKSLIDGLEQPTLRGTRKIIATCKHYAAYDVRARNLLHPSLQRVRIDGGNGSLSVGRESSDMLLMPLSHSKTWPSIICRPSSSAPGTPMLGPLCAATTASTEPRLAPTLT